MNQLPKPIANSFNLIAKAQSTNLYPITGNSGNVQLNVTNLIAGNYMVMLIQNGQLLDVKPLIKN